MYMCVVCDNLLYLLMQGIQRRFIITLSYESGTDVQWTKVTELVVGMCKSYCNYYS